MAKVEFDQGNLNRCLCPNCSVEKGSQCSLDKMPNVEKYRGEDVQFEASDVSENPDDIPATYCADMAGKSSCSDMATDRPCQCPGCTVWSGHDLQSMYYCTKGSAEEIEG